MFYRSVVSSILLYAVVCWGGGIKAWELNKLNKIIKKASSVVGLQIEGLQSVAERRIRDKLDSIIANPSHPLYGDLQDRASTFSQRLTFPPKMNTERYRLSFLPTAIRLYNESIRTFLPCVQFLSSGPGAFMSMMYVCVTCCLIVIYVFITLCCCNTPISPLGLIKYISSHLISSYIPLPMLAKNKFTHQHSV